MKSWFTIAACFLVGMFLLGGVGYLVVEFMQPSQITVGMSTASAQESPPSAPEAPVEDPLAGEVLPDPAAATEVEPLVDAASSGNPAEPVKRDLGILEGIIEAYDYSGADKRDPFVPYLAPIIQESKTPLGPITELERFDLEQLRLVGVIWNVPKPKALFLDPNQKTYVVFNKTRVGRNNGYVAEIREGEVVVIESFNNQGKFIYQPRIVKLQRE